MARRWRRTVEPVDVLVVCTGNLCRSPIIDTLLSAAVPSVTVRSAGTAAPFARPWHPLAVEALAEVGQDASAGRAHRLQRADVVAAKLVLTAEGVHRAVAVQLDPTAEDRCFTLLEAARLLRTAPAADGLGAAGLAAHLAVALRNHPAEHDDDLPDPIFGDLDDFRACRDRVSAVLDVLAPALAEPK
jgi:protein-tyrosine phosphatase